jgi:hypothetical protein
VHLVQLKLFVAACLLLACGGETDAAAATGGAGGGGGCAAGERPLDDGACSAPGVATCGQGFEPDDAGGCHAVLPATPCMPGQIALPGDTTCRPIAPCGRGTWGEIPVDAQTEHVDPSFGGTPSDGSAAAPWTTIADALLAAAPGAVVALAAGDYDERIALGSQAVTVWGRCPEMVALRGDGSSQPAVGVTGSAPVVVRGLALASSAAGFAIDGGTAELVELWIHDLDGIGVLVGGGATARLRGSAVEDVVDTGVLVLGAEAVLEDVVVRAVTPTSDGRFGRGVDVEGLGPRGSLALRHAVVEQVREHGIYVSGSDAAIESTLVRDVTPGATTDPGRGINARGNASGRAVVQVVGSVIERVRETGIYGNDADVTVDDTVVRDVALDASERFAFALSLHEIGPGAAPDAVRRSLVLRTAGVAVAFFGASAEVESVLVRDTAPLPNGLFGRGFVLQPNTGGTTGTLGLRWSSVIGSTDGGLVVFDSEAVVDGCLVDGVATNPADGSFGDGIAVIGNTPAHLRVTGSRVTHAARSGIANFSATVTIGTSTVTCNGFDLDGEAVSGPFVFDDLGGNLCGCEALGACKVLTAALGPPGAPTPQD